MLICFKHSIPAELFANEFFARPVSPARVPGPGPGSGQKIAALGIFLLRHVPPLSELLVRVSQSEASREETDQ